MFVGGISVFLLEAIGENFLVVLVRGLCVRFSLQICIYLQNLRFGRKRCHRLSISHCRCWKEKSCNGLASEVFVCVNSRDVGLDLLCNCR